MNDGSEEVIVVTQAGERLDRFLAEHYGALSRSYFQRLIEAGLVLVNGLVVKKRYVVELGDEIEIEFQLTQELSLRAEPIALDILYEDESLIAVNKPVGMVVHPAVGHPSGTFANALMYHCQESFGAAFDSLRPGIVHRLDKETSGVLIAAKSEVVQRQLVELFSTRAVEKEYLAITLGNPGDRHLSGSIGRHPTRRKEMAIVEVGGRSAETLVQTIAYNETVALVRLFPKTGRTHQLRVHLAGIGMPILGDPVYGNVGLNRKLHATRPLLHALRLTLRHPKTSELLTFRAPIPDDMGLWIKKLKAVV